MAEGNGNGTARWQLWATVAGLALVLISAMMTLYVQVNTAYNTANALQARVDKLEEVANSNRVQIAQLQASLIESDTQLRASIDDTNKGLAWQLRVNSILWEQSFKGKSHFPTDNAFYPNIANGQSR